MIILIFTDRLMAKRAIFVFFTKCSSIHFYMRKRALYILPWLLLSLTGCQNQELNIPEDNIPEILLVEAVSPVSKWEAAFSAVLYDSLNGGKEYRCGFEVSRSETMESPEIIYAVLGDDNPYVFSGNYSIDRWERGDLILYYRAFISRTANEPPVYSEVQVLTIDLDEKYIPIEDNAFKDYCVSCFDRNYDREISVAEAEKVTHIDCSNKSIKTLDGIEYFTSLKLLICENNLLTRLVLSNRASLKEVYCGHNQLYYLDVSNDPSLEALYCGSNQLRALITSNDESLARLHCYENQLTRLDVSSNVQLKELTCWSNQLTSIDVTNNPSLESFACNSNQLTSLDISNNTLLRWFFCAENQLTSLDVQCNSLLEQLVCALNPLSSLDVSNNILLRELFCFSNLLSSLDLSNNAFLEVLFCSENYLTSLDVCNNTLLMELDCTSNKLTSLDVSFNPMLNILNCWDNQMLKTIWLKEGQEISFFNYDTDIATIQYK